MGGLQRRYKGGVAEKRGVLMVYSQLHNYQIVCYVGLLTNRVESNFEEIEFHRIELEQSRIRFDNEVRFVRYASNFDLKVRPILGIT